MNLADVANKENESNFEHYAPWLVLLISLSITFLLWQYTYRTSIQQQKIEFDSRVSDIDDRIHRRIAYYEQVLYGVRSFYLNQHEMERGEFAGYIASLEIEKNFPGIQGVSFAPLVHDAHKSAYIAAQRRAGLSGYSIKPEGKRPSYAPVSYIEPFNERNARVMGFDNLSDPTRRATIERARDENRVIISERLVLKQESGQVSQAGFLMFLPVFRRSAAHDTIATRQANTDGWFAASFRMGDMMSAVLDERAKGLGIAVFDGAVISERNRMYGSALKDGGSGAPLYSTEVPIEVAGRVWSLQISSLQAFENQRDRSAEYEAVVAGGLFGLLLSWITWLLMRDSKRGLHMTRAIARELEMRLQAEHKTDELHRFNQAILEKSPSGIAVYKASGPCVMVNDAYARAIGTTVDEVLKQDFRHNTSWQRNGLLGFSDQAFAMGTSIRRDVEGVTSFGKKVTLECIFAPIEIAENPHLLLIVNDVSDRAAAEHALTESMRQLELKELAKTRFLAAAGHDLRQPLAAANLFIDALKLTATTPHQNGIITRLDSSMSTFTALLDALLNISKLDAGIIRPEYTSINVAEIFNWLEHDFAQAATEKQLGFRLYFSMSDWLVVRGDIGLLKSVLMNLVSNAIKFTRKGAILISARKRRGDVLFQVWDTGIGILDGDVKHIFDEFYQIDNPHRDRSSGLGLGLSIVQRALALMGREIKCRSRIGRGSVFAFSLPLDGTPMGARQPVAAVALEAKPATESFARGKRFIVMEDDVLVAQAMVNWLEGMGGSVKCFHSAEDALSHPNIEHADYYIADCMLAGTLNGIQFLNLIRLKLGKPIKAVVVTGDTSSAFIRNAVESDWPVLHKPINTSKLISDLTSQVRGTKSSD